LPMLNCTEARRVDKTVIKPGALSIRAFMKRFRNHGVCNRTICHIHYLLTFRVFQDSEGPVLSYDPLPPLDSVNLYVRPQRPKMHEQSNAFTMFFRSLLPNFNINEAAPVVDGLQLM
jgi:hypothetical protein